ncbi:MAG TPA: hypothetical protein VN873_08970 [Candidatus Angelobacter sp.]|nr:hypothetical protein [Candidatus Angelobacter sp.]
MKMITTKTVLVAGAALLMAPSLFAKHGGGRQGTDVLHFAIKESFTNDTASSGSDETGAKGTVTLNQAEQGSANKETMKIVITGLDPNTDYSLDAITSDNPSSTDVQDFTSDGKGHASLSFSNSGKGKKNIDLGGTDLDPVSHVLELDVVRVDNGLAVLTADLTNPSSLKYLVKRDISSDTTPASLSISSSRSRTSFRLTASGLDASTDYDLVFNGSTHQTVTTDANGNLTVTSVTLPDNILDLNSVALMDAADTTTIVSTTLP